MGNQTAKELSPIKEGFCPHCKTDLNFSEEERKAEVGIECPKCRKKFFIEESQKLQNQPKEEKKKGLTGGAAALVMFVIIVIVGAIIASSDWYQKGIPNVSEKTKPQYELGQALSGISMSEIRSNWLDEKDKSSIKADAYLESLKGESIVWIGEVEDISNYKVYYLLSDTENREIMKVKIEQIIFKTFAYIDVSGNKEYQDLNKGTKIKITGNIAGFNKIGTDMGLSPEIENATLEVVK
ncbi:MAG TPA: hypothetical protein VJY47_03085 [Candidatus Dojkabacteria bacterium]|nr:hypothetical protein [Candidatus Dojkabacteria bacterium]